MVANGEYALVAEPGSGCCDETVPVVADNQVERLSVVSGGVLALLGGLDLGVGVWKSGRSV